MSIVIPTLNSETFLPGCLDSIEAQDLPRSSYEIVIADGGSTDRTLQIAAERKVDRVVANPHVTGEAGKAAGSRAARGEILAFIDSDNILPDADWMSRMLKPFDDKSVVASEPWAYTHRRSDPGITRYCALLGMNDPLCHYLGNYDRLNGVTGKWTGLPVQQADAGDHIRVTLVPPNLPTIGANGFLIRREPFLANLEGDYFFDVDVLAKLAAKGPVVVAKVKTGIVHLYASSVGSFARKQNRRIRDFLHYRRAGLRGTTVWQRPRRLRLAWFALSTLLVLPLLITVLRGFVRKPDRAWFYHVPLCWVTLWVYGRGAVFSALGVRGPAKRAAVRQGNAAA